MAEVFDFGLQQHKIKMDGKFFENNLFAVAGDTGRRLEVQLLDSNNLVQNTTGISLRLNANVAGQATYAEATVVDATKGLYELDLPNGMLIAPGNWQFQWQITDSAGKKLHSFAFMGSIGSNLSEGGTEATNFYLNVEDLKDMQQDFIDGTFDSAALETEIAGRLVAIESSYIPRLLDVEEETTLKANKTYVDSLVGNISTTLKFKGSTLFASLPTTGMIANDYWYVTDKNSNYAYNGSEWVSIGNNFGLGDGTVSIKKAAFSKQNPNNLIRPLDFTTGYVDVAGNIVATGSSRASRDLIDIQPNTTYRLQSRFTMTGKTIYLAMYNRAGVFTRRFNPVSTIDNTTLVTFVAGENDYKYRISVNGGDEFDLFLHAGTNLLEFEEPLILDEKYINMPAPESVVEQPDFVELLSKHNQSTNQMKAKMIGDRVFWVYQPIANGKYVGHNFIKDTNDDFVVYSSAAIGYFTGDVFTIEQYLMAGSNKEFAIRVRPSGSTSDLRWFPEHENQGTAFAINQSILFDGVEKKQEITTGSLINVANVQMIQEMNLTYPGESTPTAKLNIVTTVNKDGVSYVGKIVWLKKTEVERGYVAMMPTVVPPIDTLRTSAGNDYSAILSSGVTNVVDGNDSESFAFVNKNGSAPNSTYVLAQTLHNSKKTLRKGLGGRKEPDPIWLEHRSASVQKLYPQIYLNHTADINETLEFGATMFVGILPYAGSLLF